MINQKRGHLDSVAIEHDPLVDVVVHDVNAVLILVRDAAHLEIKIERLLQLVHHLARAVRSPRFKRDPTLPGAPRREEHGAYNTV